MGCSGQAPSRAFRRKGSDGGQWTVSPFGCRSFHRVHLVTTKALKFCSPVCAWYRDQSPAAVQTPGHWVHRVSPVSVPTWERALRSYSGNVRRLSAFSSQPMPSSNAHRGDGGNATNRSKVNMHADHEVKYWTHALGVTKERLLEAVRSVIRPLPLARNWRRNRRAHGMLAVVGARPVRFNFMTLPGR